MLAIDGQLSRLAQSFGYDYMSIREALAKASLVGSAYYCVYAMSVDEKSSISICMDHNGRSDKNARTTRNSG